MNAMQYIPGCDHIIDPFLFSSVRCVLHWNQIDLGMILCRVALFCPKGLDHMKTTETLISSL